MTDLISRQAALDALDWKWAGKAAIDAIKNLPPVLTIDPVKHGMWMHDKDDCLVSGYCSVCGWQSIICETDVADMPFCPNCGAKMDEGEVCYIDMFRLCNKVAQDIAERRKE